MNQDDLDKELDRWHALKKQVESQPSFLPDDLREELAECLERLAPDYSHIGIVGSWAELEKKAHSKKIREELLKDNGRRKERKLRLMAVLESRDKAFVAKIKALLAQLKMQRQAAAALLCEIAILAETERLLLLSIIKHETKDAARRALIEMRFPGFDDALAITRPAPRIKSKRGPGRDSN